MNRLIGTKEAAKRLGVSIRRVQALITAGRLPAEKIGNSFAIKETDLKLLNGRKNGRSSQSRNVRTQEEGNNIAAKYIDCLNGLPSDLSTNPTRKRVNESIPVEKDWRQILDQVSGKHAIGPSDLATNKKHLEDLGRD